MSDNKIEDRVTKDQLEDLMRKYELGMRDAQRQIDELAERIISGRDPRFEQLLINSRKRVTVLEIAIDKACEHLSLFKHATFREVRATPPSGSMIKKELMDFADKRYQEIYESGVVGTDADKRQDAASTKETT